MEGKEVEAPPGTNGEKSLFDRLTDLKIDHNEELPPPKLVLTDKSNARIATLGNFSLITGKAKSRKSFFLTFITAVAVSNREIEGISAKLPADKSQVVYIDTEQDRYDVLAISKRVKTLTELENIDNLHIYPVRELNTNERKEAISEILSNLENVGLLIIDGIRDLISSINEESEAAGVADLLLRLTAQNSLHIAVVLHQNKKDKNARGHIGSELVNKAETVFSVEKDSDNSNVSTVTAVYSRGKEPKEIAFEIDDSTKPAIPRIIHDWCDKQIFKEKRGKIAPVELSTKELAKIAAESIKQPNERPKRADLIYNVKRAIKTEYGESIGDSKAKDFIREMTGNKLISHKGKERSPKAYYELTELANDITSENNDIPW